MRRSWGDTFEGYVGAFSGRNTADAAGWAGHAEFGLRL